MENKNSIPDEFYYFESPIFINGNHKSIPIIHETIGYIDFGEPYGICLIEVDHDDGMVPHFHVTDHKDFSLCICIYNPWWYIHNHNPKGEINRSTKISSEFGKKLTDWLKEQSEQMPELTRWEQICKIWWRVYDKEGLLEYSSYDDGVVKYPGFGPSNYIENPMPDYSKLEWYPDFEPADDTWCMHTEHLGVIDLSGDIGECDVLSFNAEVGMIPHFHIVSKDRVSFNLCVCICSNQYFYHDKSNKVKITDEHKKIIDDWLRTTGGWIKAWFNWYWTYQDDRFSKKLRSLIHHLNRSRIKNSDLIQPDYTIMSE